MLRADRFIFHKKSYNYYNLSANVCFEYKIGYSSTVFSVNCLEKIIGVL